MGSAPAKGETKVNQSITIIARAGKARNIFQEIKTLAALFPNATLGQLVAARWN